jgi:ubiquinone biosynthesis protein
LALVDLVRLPRNIQRLGEIIKILVRHGFRPFIGQLNLQEHIPFVKRWLASRAPVIDDAPTDEERLVNAFQELGPTFVKLGQILSTRPDVVGDDFADAFKTLRDHVQPFDGAEARRIIEDELRLSIDEVFAEFDNEPAGSGSIAQVHRATLKDGARVMVKVRRPGIERTILADVAILRYVARLAESQIPELRPTQIVEEFDRAIRSELDFSVEASSTAGFHAAFAETDGACAPDVFWEFTTSAVLTVERLEGVPIGDLDELDKRGHDRARLARTLTECFMTQYFQTGTFHADPHPGNLIVADDGTIGVIDFGMVGHLTTDNKTLLTTMLLAAVSGDLDFITEAAMEIGVADEDFSPKQFNRDVTDLYHKYKGMPLGRIDTRRLFGDLMRAARQNGLSLPRDLVLLGKSLATVSSVARALDPSCDVLRMSGPKTQELLKEKLSPTRLLKSAGLNSLSLMQMLRSLPRDLRSIIRKAESGRLQVGLRLRGLDQTVSELDRASNRLAMSIYVAALLVTSSMMVHTKFLAWHGLSVPGIFGYAFSGLLSLLLAWGILRSGRL